MSTSRTSRISPVRSLRPSTVPSCGPMSKTFFVQLKQAARSSRVDATRQIMCGPTFAGVFPIIRLGMAKVAAKAVTQNPFERTSRRRPLGAVRPGSGPEELAGPAPVVSEAVPKAREQVAEQKAERRTAQARLGAKARRLVTGCSNRSRCHSLLCAMRARPVAGSSDQC